MKGRTTSYVVLEKINIKGRWEYGKGNAKCLINKTMERKAIMLSIGMKAGEKCMYVCRKGIIEKKYR